MKRRVATAVFCSTLGVVGLFGTGTALSAASRAHAGTTNDPTDLEVNGVSSTVSASSVRAFRLDIRAPGGTYVQFILGRNGKTLQSLKLRYDVRSALNHVTDLPVPTRVVGGPATLTIVMTDHDGGRRARTVMRTVNVPPKP
jgi:hypothetical protein